MTSDPLPGGRRAGSVARRSVERVAAGGRRRVRDQLAVEEPLEIVLASAAGGDTPLAVTMRTPGADFDLVAGFLLSEGIVDLPADLLGMRYCPGEDRAEQRYNRVEVRLAPHALPRAAGSVRSSVTSASCGVCAMGSIEAVLRLGCPAVESALVVTDELLLSLPQRLREAQALFERTGGLHGAALFDPGGELLRVREDVGRHNAMDKLVGAALLAGELPLREGIVLLSGRIGFDLVQKAARAGVAVLAGVSAPSSLAVELAERVGLTLVGFLRNASFNIYTGGARIRSGALDATAAPR